MPGPRSTTGAPCTAGARASRRLSHARRRAAQEPRGDARVVEARDPGQHERDEQRPPADVESLHAPAAAKPAERGRDRLRPRLQLAEVARGQDDAALDRREPQAGDEELARRRSPRPSTPARCRPRSASRARASTSTLSAIGSSSEPSGDVVPRAAREPAVEPVGRHRDAEDRGRPVVVVAGSPRRRAARRAGRTRCGRRSADREASRLRENTPVARSRRCSSRTAARSRSGSSARCASSASAPSPSTPRPTAARCTSRGADEAYLIGPGPAAESYLVGERIVEAARRSGAEAIHPGYGFLAENAGVRAARARTRGSSGSGRPPGDRADGLEDRGADGDARGRRADHPRRDRAGRATSRRCCALGEEIGYPLIIKAAAGGGGKGMKVVGDAGRGGAGVRVRAARGRDVLRRRPVYVERYLEDPRHVEVQVLADAHGNVIHLGERDCTIQRRHQKLVEETPSPAVDDGAARADRRHRRRGRARGRLPLRRDDRGPADGGRRVLLHGDEHADPGRAHGHGGGDRASTSIREQVLIAAGEPLSYRQEDVVLRGHAIECRINAEDVGKGFLPAPGGSRPTASRPGPACASTPASSPAPRSATSTTR